MADIEDRQRALIGDGGFDIVLLGLVEPLQLVPLIGEIFDGFVVQKAVDRARIGFAVLGVHFAAVFHAPLGGGCGIDRVTGHHRKRRGGKREAEVMPQHCGDQRELEKDRRDAEQQIGEERFDALRASFNGAG